MVLKQTKYHNAMSAFGKAMRHHRIRSGLSQEALADRAQLDRSYMSQIERGIKNVTLNSIWRIAVALNVSPSELLRLTEHLLVSPDGAILDGSSESDFGLYSGNTATQLVASVEPSFAASLPLSAHKSTVLVCDDDLEVCSTFESVLRNVGFQTVQASSGFEAMRVLTNVRVDIVVTDVRMANGNGVELLQTMRKHYPKVPVFLVTGFGDMNEADAVKQGARGLFCKPFDLELLVATLKSSVPV